MNFGTYGFPQGLGLNSGLFGLPSYRILWTPAYVSTQLWLDASDSSTITLNSGAVSQWNDKSGNSINLFQSTPANQPTYITAGLNSLNTIRFDGINDVISSANNFPLTGNPSFSVFVLYKKSNAARGSVYGWGTSTVALNAFGIYNDNSFSTYAYAGGQGFYIDAIPNNTFLSQVYIKTSGQIASTSIAQTNGTLNTATGHSTSTPAIAPRAFNIGRWADFSSEAFEGEICELIITSFSASTDLTDRMVGYLHHKWGLTGSLPSGHPYKTTPPKI